MGLQTRIQLIRRANSEQWYVNFPSAVAQAMNFEKGETFEWIIIDSGNMLLRRATPQTPPVELPKKKGSPGTSRS